MSDRELEGLLLGGRYELREVLGRGGSATVYRAFCELDDVAVAVKLLALPSHLADAAQRELVARFQAEAKVTRRVFRGLPHVRQILDMGVAEIAGRQQPWMAMELLEGETLHDRLKRRRGAPRRLTPQQVLALFGPILDTMAFAHQRGIVHRDLKPANIFLAGDGERFVPKLLDFGISKLVEHDHAASGNTMTAAVLHMFSPQYAAPEQFAGKRTGKYTDVFALGLILTELLTDRAPLSESGDRTECMIAALDKRERPTPLGRGVNLPAEIEAVLRHAVEVHEADRFADAGALRDAFERACGTSERATPIETSIDVPPVARPPAPAPQRETRSPEPMATRFELPEPPRARPPKPEPVPPVADPVTAPVVAKTPPPRRRVRRVIAIAAAAVACAAAATVAFVLLRSPARSPTPPTRVELLVRQCGDGDAEACRTAGLAYTDGFGVDVDASYATVLAFRAFGLARRGCDAGDQAACVTLGRVHLDDLPTSRDPSKAFLLFNTACRNNEASGCANAGIMHRDGIGITSDEASAAEAFKKACDLNSLEGCWLLATYENAQLDADRRQLDHVRMRFASGCRAGHAPSCTSLAVILRDGEIWLDDKAYDYNEYDHADPAVDLPRAFALFARACDDGDGDACADLGQMHARGLATKVAPELAAGLFRRGCDLGSGAACFAVARELLRVTDTAPDLPLAARFHAKGCRAGEPRSCIALADLYAHGHGVERDRDEARRLLDKACHRHAWLGCALLADELGAQPDGEARATALREQALHMWERQCGHGNLRICNELPNYRREHGLPDQDPYRYACHTGPLAHPAQAVEHADGCSGLAWFFRNQLYRLERNLKLAWEACRLDSEEGCFVLGWLYQSVVRPYDRASALRWYRKGCVLGGQASCREASELASDANDKRDLAARYEALLDRACASGNEASCTDLADLARDKGDLATAVAGYERACEHDNSTACRRLAELHATSGKAPDPAKARAATERLTRTLDAACTRHDANKCDDLVRLYSDGELVDKNEEAATRYRKLGCRLDDHRCGGAS